MLLKCQIILLQVLTTTDRCSTQLSSISWTMQQVASLSRRYRHQPTPPARWPAARTRNVTPSQSLVLPWNEPRWVTRRRLYHRRRHRTLGRRRRRLWRHHQPVLSPRQWCSKYQYWCTIIDSTDHNTARVIMSCIHVHVHIISLYQFDAYQLFDINKFLVQAQKWCTIQRQKPSFSTFTDHSKKKQP